MPRRTSKCSGCGRDLTAAQDAPGGHACGWLRCPDEACGSEPIEVYIRVREAYCECGRRLVAA